MNYSILVFVAIFSINYVRSKNKTPGNVTDFAICKVTHLGVDYVGHIAKTESLVRCQSWTATNPIHKMNPNYTDDKFSDFSKKSAKNYCRNPNRDPDGPWCYTMEPLLINETCAVPLCSFTECRLTGSGVDYGGTHNVASSGTIKKNHHPSFKSVRFSDKKCLKWDKKRKRVIIKGNPVKIEKFPKYRFQENNLRSAEKYCRNPDGDPGGPWCFVEIEGSNDVEKQYCDIPFCNEPDCTFVSKFQKIFSHYTEFAKTETEITFGIKIWNPDAYMEAKAKLSLTLFALPLTPGSMNSGEFGIEVHISNTKTGLTTGNVEEPVPEMTPQLLKATEYTYFTLSWGGSFVTLNKVGTAKPIFIAQYKMKDNLMAYKKDQFYYYSVLGENMLWAFPYCNADETCKIHTTTSAYYQRFWPLGISSVGHDLKYFVRAFHSANIILVASPVVEYPRVEIFLGSKDNYTRIILSGYDAGPKVTLFEMSFLKLLDYWDWREFSLSLFADTLALYKTRETGTFLIAEVKSDVIRTLRWFSVASVDSLAHWTLFCKPAKSSYPPPAWLPECALNAKESNYNGSQSVTSEGLPCIPWSSNKLLPKTLREFYTVSKQLPDWNYCRDPRNLKNG